MRARPTPPFADASAYRLWWSLTRLSLSVALLQDALGPLARPPEASREPEWLPGYA